MLWWFSKWFSCHQSAAVVCALPSLFLSLCRQSVLSESVCWRSSCQMCHSIVVWVCGSDSLGVSVLSAKCPPPPPHPRFAYCFWFTVLPSELTAEDTCLQTQKWFLVFPEVCLKCVALIVEWRRSQRTRKRRKGKRLVNQCVMHANSYLSLPKLTNH